MNEAEWKDGSSSSPTNQTCCFPEDGQTRSLVPLPQQLNTAEDNRGLLAELVRIEQELRESLQKEEERQQEVERIRQEENQQRWRSLCFLYLNQRTTKYEPDQTSPLQNKEPWVTSYYKNIPMHIYCLPIETVSHRQKQKKKR